jgi:hypothetical protein
VAVLVAYRMSLANNLSQLAMTISVMEVSMMTWSLWETFAK